MLVAGDTVRVRVRGRAGRVAYPRTRRAHRVRLESAEPQALRISPVLPECEGIGSAIAPVVGTCMERAETRDMIGPADNDH